MSKLTIRSINTRVASVVKSGAKFNNDIQALIVDIAEFAFNPEYNPVKTVDGSKPNIGNQNVTPAKDLIEGLTRKADKSALIKWFAENCGIKYYAETKNAKTGIIKPATMKLDAKNPVKWDIDKAKADLWYVIKEQEKAETGRTTKFDAVARLTSLVTALSAAMQDGKSIEGDLMPEGLVQELDALLQKYNDGASAIVKAIEPDNTNEVQEKKARKVSKG